MFHFQSSKLFIVVLVVLVIATSAYAYAAANTGSTRSAGNHVSGYSVSNIFYAFDTATPPNITTVAFDLDNPAATVKVRLTADGTLQPCESATPFTHWTCAISGVNTANVTAPMRIVVGQ